MGKYGLHLQQNLQPAMESWREFQKSTYPLPQFYIYLKILTVSSTFQNFLDVVFFRVILNVPLKDLRRPAGVMSITM